MTAPELVDIRRSHLLRDCAVGAIVRSGDTLMVVQDTRCWDGPRTDPHDREIRNVEQVKRALKLKGMKLCQPPERRDVGGVTLGYVPARRFPEWTWCSLCGWLDRAPWWKRANDSPATAEAPDPSPRPSGAGLAGTAKLKDDYPCTRPVGEGRPRCRGRLRQVPWVLVHENGYLADVPWYAIAHAGAKGRQADCVQAREKPQLQIGSAVGGGVGRVVTCCRCNARSELPTRFPYGSMTPQQPWPPKLPPDEPLKEPGWILGVNDVRVHMADCATALVIPPESRIGAGREGCVLSAEELRSIRGARNDLTRTSRIRSTATKHRCSVEDVKNALSLDEMGGPFHDQEVPRGELPQLEYEALTKPISDLREDEDFVPEHRSDDLRQLAADLGGEPSAAIAGAVDQMVGLRRLKEIMVFNGFRRIGGEGLPTPQDLVGQSGHGGQGATTTGPSESRPPTQPDLVGRSDWLPAIELFGEGLFFTLEEDRLCRWEHQDAARARAEEFVTRAVEAPLRKEVKAALSPRFLLCHTLAHLIIRRLEAHAGYPAASLKERIYCADSAADGDPMAGVLIYVAVADKHGSLGGLMEFAQPERFLRLLTGAVEDARWCSFDPVCGDRDGHGPYLLNRAACHSCVLVPEPSCICGNRLLDRTFVRGGDGLLPLWEMDHDR